VADRQDWQHPHVDLIAAAGKLLCSIDETAFLLGCSRRTVYRLIEAGRLRTVRPGGLATSHQRIRRAELDRYVASLGEAS
jgi:excisionase family DNA binding protein